MEPAPLLLLLALLWGCSGRAVGRLVVTPQEPVVPYGGSVQLNCSLHACAEGMVQWKGLDANLGSVTSFPTHSILQVTSAVVAMGGTKICQGACHGQYYQRTVNLKVYALPEGLQLEAAPQVPLPGQPLSLRCSAHGVYPHTGLLLTWYRGDQALPAADPDVTETEDELFDIVATLAVDGKEVEEGTEFRCEVTLSIGQETFSRVASVVVSAGGEASSLGWRRMELVGDGDRHPVGMMCPSSELQPGPCPALFTATTEQMVATGTPWPAAALTGSPSTAATTAALPAEPSVPTHGPTAQQEPDAGTLPEPAAATERPAPGDMSTGSPRAHPATAAALPGSGTAEMQRLEPSAGTVPACSLRLWSLPPNGTRGRALRIECRARCPGNATVRWLRTPVALSQYRQEAAGSSSTLRLDRAEPRHQGHYQCVLLGHGSHAASLHLTVLDDAPTTGPAVAAGTTVSLLGLILAGAGAHRLWKRFHSQYELP
ncbi:mucosal addressin cell adhesion molecule 1 [Strigops habroptila]|uniref:mucosal addressin cell adhesion molecule 1 n=1 Tax=Strigops habroptila TaxID=2489341 RepID=UPI0011D00A57|nr:mucosal addressin cell adhesion molecule 1 [Strigops habroptila]